MKTSLRFVILCTWTCLAFALAAGLAAAPGGGGGDAASADEAFKQLRRYDDGQAREPLRTIEQLVARSTNDPARRREVAARLAAILADPKASRAAKVFICGQLPLVAGDEHVALLTKMLSDAKTADMARRALAAIPGEASGKALRDALGTLKGDVLIGVANSLGDRRDAEAVAGLEGLLTGTSPKAANAAARALGKIGTPAAARALSKANASANPDALSDGLLRCAEHLAAEGSRAEAVRIYTQILASKRPERRRVAGLAGLVRIGEAKAVPELLKAMGSDSALLRAAALRLACGVRGPEVTAALVRLLDRSKPDGQAALIDVLGERGDRAASAAVAKRLDDRSQTVRLAAIRAMARLGDASSVGRLARLAADQSRDIRQAARRSLERLEDPRADRAMLAAAARGEPEVRVEAIRALAARRTDGAAVVLAKLTSDSDEGVRVAALNGLAVMGTRDCYGRLVELLTSPPSPATALTAEKAALAVGGRLAPVERAGPLLAALKDAPSKAKPPLLRLLGHCGGGEALEAVRRSAMDRDKAVSDAAVRALAAWPDESAVEDLLRLARDSRSAVHRTVALRGYFRLARQAKGGAPARLKMLKQVRQIATTTDAKRLLLAALSDVADTAALDLALSMLDDGQVRPEAARAALRISRSLVARNRAAVRSAMEKLRTKVMDEAILKEAEALRAAALRPSPKQVGREALRPNKQRSEARRQELTKRAPKGYRLVCYLDCGPDVSDGAKGGAALRVLDGATYFWPGAERAADARFGSVHFAGGRLRFEAGGLNPKKAYRFGFTWWDYDHDTRVESLWASAGEPVRTVKLLGATKLPSYAADRKLPEEQTLPIPRELSVFGTVGVTFRNEGQPNAVVSEVWLWESEAESPPPAPMAVQSRPAGKLAKPRAFRPGKKAGKRVLIVTGIDYPGHKWRQTTPVLAAGLDKDARLAVDIVETPDFLRSAKLGDYDVIVLHFMNWQTPDPGPEARANLRRAVAGGKGLVLVHFACGAFQGWGEFAKLAGRAWNPKLRGHDPRGPFRVNIVDRDHPVTRGMKAFETDDEMYTCLAGDAPIRVLASAISKVDKKEYPMAFVLSYGKGRVFHSPLGHDVKAFAPPVLELFRRGTAWAAGLDRPAKRN